MTISQAIEKAIEGGYHRGQIGTSPIVEINCDFAITETKGERNHYGLAWVWLDPLFWQCYGKAMGWIRTEKAYHWAEIELARERWNNSLQRDMEKKGLGKTSAVTVILEQELCQKINAIKETDAWLFEWHRFIDKLANGGTAEQFFEEL